MKKVIIGLACFFGGLFTLLIVARLTNILAVYHIPASGNLPTLQVGSIVFASRIKTPQNGDFIAFKHDNQTWIFRMVAQGGDRIEMRTPNYLSMIKRLKNRMYITSICSVAIS